MSARSTEPTPNLDQTSPRWSVHITDLHGDDEIFVHAKRKVLIDPTRHGENWMRAHVAAHFDLSHHLRVSQEFSAEQELDADALAQAKLDFAGRCGVELFELPPIDGDPSVTWGALT